MTNDGRTRRHEHAQVWRSFSESILASVVLAELAVLLGIGFAYYGEATAGGVIVLVAVAIYAGTVVLGRVIRATGENATPELDHIGAADSEATSD